jgi:hypothetical protein
VGRNDRCPCGSGKKYKQCHGRTATSLTNGQRWLVALVTLAFVGGLAFVLSTRQEPDGRPTGVWSAEHGHYH